jgi:ATP phosphoribosyltransferase regulatory subunit
MNNKLHAPEGTFDLMPEEVRIKRRIEKVLMKTFEGYGYKEIETPAFEYFDVFEGNFCGTRPEMMFRFFDVDGRLLTLRPDLTTPAVRLASTKIHGDGFPVRLCYVGHAFRNNETVYGAKMKEFTQAGIELFGVNSPMADAEVIAATIDSLSAAGLEDFCMEIGQVAIFRELVKAARIDETASEQLREYIDNKDVLSVRHLLKEYQVSEGIRELLFDLPNLFGGAEVFDRVKTDIVPAWQAVENLRMVYDRLQADGYEKFLSIDLGMVQSLDYYTGIIFKGFTKHMGFSVCTGGRYDNLCGAFGRPRPATGVAIGVDRLQSVLSRQNKFDFEKPEIIVVAFESGAEQSAAKVLKKVRGDGACGVLSLTDNPVLEARHAEACKLITAKAAGGFEIWDMKTGEKKTVLEI